MSRFAHLAYTDLLEATQESFKNLDKKFHLSNTRQSTFAIFTKKTLTLEERDELAGNWKIHLSINPASLSDAWDIIYPLLNEHADQFKIFKNNRLDEDRVKTLTELQKWQNLRASFIAQDQNKQTLDDLKNLARKYFSPSNEYKNFQHDYSQLHAYILQKYDGFIKEVEEEIAEQQRISEGMQITIYTRPGTEVAHQALLETIEGRLKANNIKPGKIYNTERALGHYSSIRHPGSIYQLAVTAANYNPDNKPDPFGLSLYDTTTLGLMDLQENIQKLINLLKETSNHPDPSIIEKNRLGRKIEEKTTAFFQKSFEDQKKGLTAFANSCIEDIKEADKKIENIKEADKKIKNDKEWKSMFKNLLLFFSDIGRRALTKYSFFERKKDVTLDCTHQVIKSQVTALKQDRSKSVKEPEDAKENVYLKKM